jgi:hypothetical protein
MPLIIYRGEIKTKLACVGALLCAMSARRWSSAWWRNEKKKNGKSTFVFTGQRNLIYWKLGKPFVYWLSASVTQHTNTTHFLTISSLHLLGYCVRRPAAVDSKEFACCLVPWRERKSSPFLSLNWEWHWLDDLRGVERQKKKKSWKFTWTQFFFFFFFLKDFLFFLNWWRGLSGRLWEAHT